MATPKNTKSSLLKRLTEGDLVNYLNIGAAAAFCVVMTMLIFGQSLGIFGAVGLDWMFQTRGVYADCSKIENRHNPFCQPKVNHTDRDWSDLGKNGKRAMPFTLHGQ